MLTNEEKNQFSEILEELGNSLDITETQYKAVVKSYEAVGTWLSKEDSLLAPYKPEILPQGSFMLGTMIKPIHDKDDLDIDLVCQLKGKNPYWTQSDLKHKVGDQLKKNDTYKDMLDDEGRRCWTLEYSESLNYHMDVLPSIVDTGYRLMLEKALSRTELNDIDKLAIRITDNEQRNYQTERNHLEWLKSNPFGYAKWFENRTNISTLKMFSINDSIKPVPTFRKEKLPLQRVVQILKRHRDMMFKGDEHKPISIIITTLAAQAYNKETDIIEALLNVVSNMRKYIKDYNPHTGEPEKWIHNPVNDEENFADKWKEYPIRETNFYKWLDAVERDVSNIINQRGKGLQLICESMITPFGKDVITKAFSSYGEKQLRIREIGGMKMAAGTGMLGNTGRTDVPQHKPFGKNE
jgi:hypothetical protein